MTGAEIENAGSEMMITKWLQYPKTVSVHDTVFAVPKILQCPNISQYINCTKAKIIVISLNIWMIPYIRVFP